MMSRRLALIAGAVLVLCGSLFSAGTASAQQPTPAAVSMAKEILEAKGSMAVFEPIVIGVIEQTKNVLLQQSPNLQKDLNETAGTLRTQFLPRTAELKEEVSKIYAAQFTEAELKDVLTFFKSPVGQKMVLQDTRFVEASLTRAQAWANKMSDEVMLKFRSEMKKKGYTL